MACCEVLDIAEGWSETELSLGRVLCMGEQGSLCVRIVGENWEWAALDLSSLVCREASRATIALWTEFSEVVVVASLSSPSLPSLVLNVAEASPCADDPYARSAQSVVYPTHHLVSLGG